MLPMPITVEGGGKEGMGYSNLAGGVESGNIFSIFFLSSSSSPGCQKHCSGGGGGGKHILHRETCDSQKSQNLGDGMS